MPGVVLLGRTGVPFCPLVSENWPGKDVADDTHHLHVQRFILGLLLLSCLYPEMG